MLAFCKHYQGKLTNIQISQKVIESGFIYFTKTVSVIINEVVGCIIITLIDLE